MTRPSATIRINTTYVEDHIAQQYASILVHVLSNEFPDWAVAVIPGDADAVELPIEDRVESFRTECRVRDLMTASLMQAVDDCRNELDGPQPE